jgi:hypothetical protein
MTRQEALMRIADGHMVYSQEFANGVCDALGVPQLKGEPMYSDPPGTFKGLMMKEGSEGDVCVRSLDLGHHACKHYGLEANERFGRGSQGREYSRCLAEHFAKAGVA